MGKKIFIDAGHPEETRIVVLKGNKVEDFDFESAAHKQLRGNIYLAKVTRVEPSLQAAFVDYGGNRHGFLAFSEIHTDYYQIPLADRQALLEEEQVDQGSSSDDDDEETKGASAADVPEDPISEDEEPRANTDSDNVDKAEDSADEADGASETDDSEDVGTDSAAEAATPEDAETANEPGASDKVNATAVETDETATETEAPAAVEDVSEAVSEEEASPVEETASADASEDDNKPEIAQLATEAKDDSVKSEIVVPDETEEVDLAEAEQPSVLEDPSEDGDEDEGNGNGESVESVGAEDAMEEVPQRRRKRRREYKIQEVIKRRQIILVQVVKEERGNKGAALTTYLSMAGRYCVLMPNTSRGGGISRKISDTQDRKRLKEVATNLDIPEGMGLIVRTAGANRTKAEIKRDFDYLLRLWESVRDLTLSSNAPNLVYEEGSLIKRSIRDLYDKDVDSVEVEGEAAYRDAKGLMKMLMPSHAKNVKAHKDSQPLFSRSQIETQLDALYSPQVTLPSGGYIVINQTEALVAVDVNSGKSTREHNVEQTALKTNCEAAEETARQMRLRDLAGLIVIDFIDMEERRNNRTVERKLKDALKNDRARIQVGRIGHFGLLEMSRQRMRTGVLEGSTLVCHHCEGQGFIRSVESCALSVLRGAEEHLMGQKSPNSITVRCDSAVAAYILNQKRDHLHALESAFSVVIFVEISGEMRGSDFKIEKADAPSRKPAQVAAVSLISAYSDKDSDAAEDEEAVRAAEDETDVDGEEEKPRRRKRRRGRRGGRGSRGWDNQEAGDGENQDAASEDGSSEKQQAAEGDAASDEGGEGQKRGRKRRSRGGRGRRNEQSASSEETEEAPAKEAAQPALANADLETVDPWDTTPVKEPVAAKAETAEEAEVKDGAPKPEKKLRTRKPRKKAEPKAKKGDKDAAAESKKPAEEAPSNGSDPATEPAPEAAPESGLKPVAAEPAAPPPPPEPDRPKRRGWWQRG